MTRTLWLATLTLGLLTACLPNPVDYAVDRAVETGIQKTLYKVLPQNELPFADDFEGYPEGALLTRAAPARYRLWREGETPANARVETAAGPGGAPGRVAVLERPEDAQPGPYALTTGADDWANYTARAVFFPSKPDWTLYLNLNGKGANAYVLEVRGETFTLYRQQSGDRRRVAERDLPVRAGGTWLTLVARVRTDRILVELNGRTVADYAGPAAPALGRGGFGLQPDGPGTVLRLARWSFAPQP